MRRPRTPSRSRVAATLRSFGAPVVRRHRDSLTGCRNRSLGCLAPLFQLLFCLEDEFWSGLKEIAKTEHASLSNMVAEIDKKRQQGNLSSAIRLFVLDQVRAHPQ